MLSFVSTVKEHCPQNILGEKIGWVNLRVSLLKKSIDLGLWMRQKRNVAPGWPPWTQGCSDLLPHS